MSDQLATILFGAVILFPIAIFVWQIRRVRRGTQSKVKGTALFFAYATLPVLLNIALFFVLVGFEEVTGRDIITEGYNYVLVALVGTGSIWVVLTTSFFGLLAFLSKPGKKAG